MPDPTYEELVQRVNVLEEENQKHKSGYEEPEIIGQPLTVLMPASFVESHKRALANHVKTGESRVIGQTLELAGLTKGGLEFPLELSISSWQVRGKIYYTGIILKHFDDLVPRNDPHGAAAGFHFSQDLLVIEQLRENSGTLYANMVYPSLVPFSTHQFQPTCPPAPGLLMITMGCPKYFSSPAIMVTIRAWKSVAPQGE